MTNVTFDFGESFYPLECGTGELLGVSPLLQFSGQCFYPLECGTGELRVNEGDPSIADQAQVSIRLSAVLVSYEVCIQMCAQTTKFLSA